MMKKLLAIMLAVVMLTAFAGCSGKEKPAESGAEQAGSRSTGAEIKPYELLYSTTFMNGEWIWEPCVRVDKDIDGFDAGVPYKENDMANNIVYRFGGEDVAGYCSVIAVGSTYDGSIDAAFGAEVLARKDVYTVLDNGLTNYGPLSVGYIIISFEGGAAEEVLLYIFDTESNRYYSGGTMVLEKCTDTAVLYPMLDSLGAAMHSVKD